MLAESEYAFSNEETVAEENIDVANDTTMRYTEPFMEAESSSESSAYESASETVAVEVESSNHVQDQSKVKKVIIKKAKTVASPSLVPPVSKAAAFKTKKPTATEKKKGGGSNSNHPSYLDMIVQAIESLNERKGSSRAAILKFVMTNFDVGSDPEKVNVYIKQALKRGIDNNILVHSTQVNTALPSFLLDVFSVS